MDEPKDEPMNASKDMETIQKAVCRVCFSAIGQVDVFTKDFCIPLEVYKIIMDVANVKIEITDGLPTSICKCCSSKLRVAYYFKQQCEATDRILREKQIQLPELFKVDQANALGDRSSSDTDAVNDPVEWIKDNIMEPEVEIEEQHNEITPVNNIRLNNIEYDYNTTDTSISNSEISKQKHDEELELGSCRENFLKFDFERHMAIHSEERNCFTNPCKTELKTAQELGSHNEVDNQQHGVYFCNMCNEGSLQLQAYEDHMRVHNEVTTFPCPEPEDIKIKTPTIERVYNCEKCNIIFNCPANRSQHMRQEHSEDTVDKRKGLICGDCGFYCRYPSLYKEHMIRKHNNGSLPYKCTECDKAYNFPSSLWRHMITHKQSRPFVCTTCGKGFNQQPHLKKHMRGVHKMIV